jgi:hypothetical protein
MVAKRSLKRSDDGSILEFFTKRPLSDESSASPSSSGSHSLSIVPFKKSTSSESSASPSSSRTQEHASKRVKTDVTEPRVSAISSFAATQSPSGSHSLSIIPFERPTSSQSLVSPSSSASHSLPIVPFERFGLFGCPFCAYKCKSKTGRNAHVRAKHENATPRKTVEQDPLEDGSKKIPCPKRCGAMFACYKTANFHSKLPAECPLPFPTPIVCAWKHVIGCSSVSDSPRGNANHARSHLRDERGPYRCSKACGECHADLYMVSHLHPLLHKTIQVLNSIQVRYA